MISDYNSLVSEAKVWAARTDSVFSARFPVFVANAEERLYNGHGEPGDTLYTPPIRSKVMEATATVTIADGVGTIPSDALSIRKVTRASDTSGLVYAPPHQWDEYLAEHTGSGLPLYFTVEASTISVAPTWNGDLTVSYFKRFDPLTSENKEGALLSAHPTAYLNAVLHECFSFMQEVDLAVAYAGKLKATIDGINKVASDVRAGGGRLRIISRPIGG